MRFPWPGIQASRHPVGWRDWQRREDYYAEGVLLWLDVDARLRARSGGRLRLDDVARRFFSTGGGQHATTTYRFADVCAALHAVLPDDWTGILRTHLDSHRDADALAGLAHPGWQIAYGDVPRESFRQDEADAGVSNLDYSIGLQVRRPARSARSRGIVRRSRPEWRPVCGSPRSMGRLSRLQHPKRE